MQKTLPSSRLGRWLAGAGLVLLTSVSARAQLSGTKTIPGSYASLAAAITDLNAQGVGAGGVTFNVAAGYTETFSSAAAGAITATGTSANPIVFQKAGSGANPLLTAGAGTSTTADAIISLAGSDYVTFTGIDLLDPASNATATTAMEFGFLLGRTGAGATLDGTNNNVIRNSTITLQRTYTNTTNNTPYGIFATAGTVAVPFTALSATSAPAAGQSSNNTFAGNTIQNVNGGIYLQGLNDATPYANYDQGNAVGGATAAAGNTIQNYGGAATQAYGIRLQYQNNVAATYNTVANATAGGVAGASTLYGIYAQSGTNTTSTLSRNTLTLVQAANSSQVAGIYNATAGTGTLTIDYNTFSLTATASTGTFYNAYNSGSFSATTGTVFSFSNNTISHTATGAASNAFYALYNSGSHAGASVVNNNQFLNAANAVTTTGTIGFWYNSGSSSTGAISFANNQWSLNRTGTSGSTYGYYNGSSPTGPHTFTGNTFSNIAQGSSSGDFYGFYANTSSSQLQTVTGNTVSNVTGGSGTTAPIYLSYGASGSTVAGNTVTNVSATGTTYGIYTGTSFAGGSISGNTVGNVSSSGAGSAANGLRLNLSGATATLGVYANKVYGIASTSSTGTAAGLYVGSTGVFTVYNNLVGNITAPASTSSVAAAGIYLSTGTTVNVYYNTVYLAGTSSASGFGSAGIYASTTPTLTLTDNVVVNTSVATGTGIAAAYRRSSTTLTTYATASNNNLFYAGTPGTTQVIYTDGTSTYATLAAYKTAMATRDQASVTELPPFASTTGTAATFLHIAPGTATQVESGGTPVSGITTDYDNDTRNASTPDIGADEGSFSPAVLIAVTGTTYTQNSAPTATGQVNQQVTGVVVTTTGQTSGPTLSSITFDVGSTSLGNISNARLYSASSSTFSLASATLLATTGVLASPSFTLTLTTPVALASGNNYFFLTYDIPATATVGATVASTATAVVVSGTTYTPTLSGPAGSRLILGALVGTYYITGTVGSSPDPTKEFATLTAAAAAYNSRSLGGAVTFVLRDATYSTTETFPIAFNANAAASATNTLTIQPGVTSTITAASTSALLLLNGASYVTVNGSLTTGGTTRDLTLSNTGGGPVVQVVSGGTGAGATNDALRNLNMQAQALTSGIAIAAGGATAGSTGADNDNLTIQNNSIQQAYVGIYVGGTAAASTGGTDGLTITGNTFGTTASGASSIGNIGLFVANAVSPVVTNNTIQNIGLGATAAQALTIGATFPTGVSGATLTGNTISGVVVNAGSYDALGLNLGTGFSGVVDRNRVLNVASYTATYGGRGIDVNTGSTTSNLRLSNNFVAGINGAGWTSLASDAVVGIRLLGTTGGVSLYYNSVSLTGINTRATTSADVSAALYVASGVTTLDMRNNIFSNTSTSTATGGAKSYALYSAATKTAYATLNYNDYYVAGTQGVLGNLGGAGTVGTSTTDLTAVGPAATANTFQNTTTGFGQDANSISADPQFTSATDLHAIGAAINNAATPLAAVTTDIDGETRSTTTPDIGADEFTPIPVDVAANALLAPAQPAATGGTCYGAAEPVTVQIRNTGSAALNFANNPATVSVTVTGPGTPGTLTAATLSSGTLAVGATQSVTLGGTVNLSAPGTYSFAITATATGDGNAANNALTATVTVGAPVAGTLTSTVNSFCQSSGATTFSLSGYANGSVQYQSSSSATGTFTDVAGATSATYTTPTVTATTYYRAQVRCGTNVVTSSVIGVFINDPQVAATNGPVAICAGSPATVSATVAAGSTTAVRFFAAASGGPALAGATTSGSTTSLTTGNLTASTTYYAEAYTPNGGSEATGPTTQTSTGLSAQTGGALYLTTTAATNLQAVTVFLAAGQAAGTVTIDLRAGNSTAGALVNNQSVAFAVPANTTAAVASYVIPLSYVIPAAGQYTLYLSGATQGGLLRDSGGTNTTAYPFTSPSGTVSITASSLSGYYYYFYNLQTSTDCVNSTRTAIQVNVTQPATASFPSATASTCGTTGYQLAGTVGGGATTGTYTSSGTGTFSPSATTLNATYTPSAADVAAGTVTITLSTAAVGGCPAATATLALSISAAPVASFSYPATTTYCAGSASTVTPTLGTGATAGTFSSTTGLTIDAATGVITLSSSVAGTYTVTNTLAASGPCAATSATTTVTIAPATSAAFSYTSASYCQTGTNPTPTVTGTAGGAFSSTAGLSISATTGVIDLSASTLGTYTVTYTVAGPCGSSATATVTITAGQVATFSYPATTTYCAGSASTITPTVTGAAGTFTAAPAGLTINAATGVITLSTSAAGTYTVTNTVAAGGGCGAATATATVIITPATSATFSYPAASYCVSSTTNPAATVTGTAGGTFSSTTGLSLNATTGAINLAASTPGTYTVTYTVAGACGSSSTQTVTITAAPLASFSYPATTTYCAGSASTVTPTLGAGATAGTFSSTTGLTINATTGVITLSSSVAGTYTVTNTVAASNGCAAATATATVTITPATSAAFSYASASYCVSGTTSLTATVTGTTGGTFTATPAGLSLNATTGAIALSASTPGTYTVTYTVAGACGSSSTQTVTITAAPLASFSYPATGSNCAGSAGTVAATLGTGATAGTFSSTTGLSLNATTGAVNLAASVAGTYTVTNTVAAAGGCAAATATATITVNPTPATPTLTATGTSATGITLTSSAATGNQFYLNGVLIPGATGQTYLVNSGTRNGQYTVVVTNATGCSSAASAAVNVTVTATAGGQLASSLRVYPNPTPNGQLTLELSGQRSATQLTVLDAVGRVVLSESLPASTGTVTHALDLSGAATGVYLLRLSSPDGVEVRRLTRE